MAALLSQAIANQLRQVPGFQDPRPSPATLLQQVLNPPGPSRPTWMAPVMENRQLLATNTPEARQALAQDALKAAMAFGGADITKEQRAAWEQENEAYRSRREVGTAIPTGSRVLIRPAGARVKPQEWSGGVPEAQGVVVIPGSPEAGKPGVGVWGGPIGPPTPDHVAVRNEDSRYWFWRHRNDLEVLPPLEEFPVGTPVEYSPERGRVLGRPWEEAQIGKPPAGEKPPSPNQVWVEYVPRDEFIPPGAGWYHKNDLKKIKLGGK